MLSSEVQVPIKVSVVVPVFNPGKHIMASVDSLLAQTMPADELELIFVDDGSTDDTPAVLDRLAAEHAQVRVIHEPPSGWAGRPRNVGIDAATGEYVMFVDQDDWLGVEALDRMYAMARRNVSDIVIGKMVGVRRNVPVLLFRRSWEDATIHDSPIIDSLTPHKMFRREFLLEAGLRFPEGRRRLEDHVFVVAAYFAAKRISVLSDYDCYFHISRDDRGNAGFHPLDPPSYLAFLREALDVVDAHTEPGPARDRLHRRWLRVELIGRLRGRKLLNAAEDFREEFLREARALVQERFTLGVDAGLSPMERLAAHLLRAGDLAGLVQLATWEAEVSLRVRLRGATWQAGSLVVDVVAEPVDGSGEPVRLQERGARRVLAPPLPPGVLETLPDDLLTVRDDAVSLTLVVRQLGAERRELLPGTCTGNDALDLGRTVTSRLLVQPPEPADGPALPDGVWEVFAEWRAFGWSFTAVVRTPERAPGSADALGGPALLGPAPRLALPHRGPSRRFRVELCDLTAAVPARRPKVQVDQARSRVSVRRRSARLDLTLRLATDRPHPVTVGFSPTAGGGSASSLDHRWPGVLEPLPNGDGYAARSRLSAQITPAPRLAPGDWTVELFPGDAPYGLPVRWPLTVTRRGSLRPARKPARSRRARVLALLPTGVDRRLRALLRRT